MKPEVVFALYRPNKGKEKELEKIIANHYATLHKYELVTDRTPIVVKSQDGTYIEIYEWVSSDASRKAHDHPAIAKIWEAMGAIGDFDITLDQLPESKKRFSHFTPVSLE